MKIDELLARARETVTVRMVFAEPYEKDGLTIIPAARVVGGGGGGSGRDKEGRRGDGGGLGLVAKPVGAFVIKDGQVRWHPALDVTQLVTTIGAVIIGGLMANARRRKK
jgi:uncharacterized spore protein YtfJ